jgi:Amt family ammonium transporter
MHYFPGGSLRLRCDEETEIVGVDEAEMGEFAYDYVGLETELGPRHEYHNKVGATGGSREPNHVDVEKASSEHTSHDEKNIITEKTVETV